MRTTLRRLGMDHTQLTYQYLTRSVRHGDVHGNLVEGLLAGARLSRRTALQTFQGDHHR